MAGERNGLFCAAVEWEQKINGDSYIREQPKYRRGREGKKGNKREGKEIKKRIKDSGR